MHAIRFKRTRVATAIGGLGILLAAGHAFGAAFALQENSGSGLGNAFAGGAASAEDVSTIWVNPAGMSRLATPQVAGAVHFVMPSFKFKDEGSQAAAFQPLGGTGGDAGDLAVIPNLYAAMPLNNQWAIGIGINAPFGLVTEYDSNWLGRFQGVKSDIKTINVNPSVSWRLSNTVSVGVGVNWQRVDAELTSKFNYSAALVAAAQSPAAGIPPALLPAIVAATPPGLESNARVKGDDSAWGWNIGLLWDVTPQTRLGASYRSSVKYNVSANATFEHPALPTLPPALAPVFGLLAGGVNGALQNGGVKADIELPDIANISLFTRLDDRWDLMADVQYTGWSSFKELKFVRTTGTNLAPPTPENFDDAWRVSVGATYHWNDQWSFRGGLAWDQTPTNTPDRTPRLPDEDRFWIAAGAQYKVNRNLVIDAGITYIPIKTPNISQNAGSTAANGLIKGSYDANVTVISAQLTYTF